MHVLHFSGPLVSERGFFLGHVSSKLGWTSCGKGFLLLFVSWFIVIHTRASHPLGVGYFNRREHNGCCPGGLFHIKNTLHICTTLQQHCSISLLHDEGHTAEELGIRVAKLGFRTISIKRILLFKYNSIN